MRVEKDIQKLDDEIKASKVILEQSATTLNLFSTQQTFTTSKRTYSFTTEPGSYQDPMDWMDLWYYLEEGGTFFVGPFIADELLQVTFRSDNGSNTLATLELEVLADDDPFNDVVHIIRTNYSGGARWILDVFPNVENTGGGAGFYFRWKPTTLKITVRSIMPGTLEVVQL